MRLLIFLLIIVGVVVVLGMRLLAKGRSRPADPADQPTVIEPGPPAPGRHPVDLDPRRPDGSPVPGSRADREASGKP